MTAFHPASPLVINEVDQTSQPRLCLRDQVASLRGALEVSVLSLDSLRAGSGHPVRAKTPATGIGSAYEAPEYPDIRLEAGDGKVEELADRVVAELELRAIIR